MEPVVVDAPDEGKSSVFTFRDGIGLYTEGFVTRFRGEFYAYRNQCRHQPVTLDFGDGDFYTDNGEYLMCMKHGALFDPQSGLCVSGPCFQARLFTYPLEVQADGRIKVMVDDEVATSDLE